MVFLCTMQREWEEDSIFNFVEFYVFHLSLQVIQLGMIQRSLSQCKLSEFLQAAHV